VSEAELSDIEIGEGAEARTIAVLRRTGTAPDIVWLGGYRSDMAGTKAEALEYIEEVWTDMRPLSLRKKMEGDIKRIPKDD